MSATANYIILHTNSINRNSGFEALTILLAQINDCNSLSASLVKLNSSKLLLIKSNHFPEPKS
jgi:hypothetical protein